MERKQEVFPLNLWNLKVPVLEFGRDLQQHSSPSVENRLRSALLCCFSWLPTHSGFSVLYSPFLKVYLDDWACHWIVFACVLTSMSKISLILWKIFSLRKLQYRRLVLKYVMLISPLPQIELAQIFLMLFRWNTYIYLIDPKRQPGCGGFMMWELVLEH